MGVGGGGGGNADISGLLVYDKKRTKRPCVPPHLQSPIRKRGRGTLDSVRDCQGPLTSSSSYSSGLGKLSLRFLVCKSDPTCRDWGEGDKTLCLVARVWQELRTDPSLS